MELTTLPVTERNRIWRTLNNAQQKIFTKNIRSQMADRLLNQTFRGAAQWRLFAVNIDYDWEARKAGLPCGAPLRCQCGRRLRYQYELESVGRSHKHVKLGSTHFAEHLGIPISVANEVKNRVSSIQSVMDELLVKFRHGERFPARFNNKIHDGMLYLATESFAERVLDFQRVDLPLFSRDVALLQQMMMKYSPSEIAAAKATQPSSKLSTLVPPHATSDTSKYLNQKRDYIQNRLKTHFTWLLQEKVSASQRIEFSNIENDYLHYLSQVDQRSTSPEFVPACHDVDMMMRTMRSALNSTHEPENKKQKKKKKQKKQKKLIKRGKDPYFNKLRNLITIVHRTDLPAPSLEKATPKTTDIFEPMDTSILLSLPSTVDPLIRKKFVQQVENYVKTAKRLKHQPISSQFIFNCRMIESSLRDINTFLTDPIKRQHIKQTVIIHRIELVENAIEELSRM